MEDGQDTSNPVPASAEMSSSAISDAENENGPKEANDVGEIREVAKESDGNAEGNNSSELSPESDKASAKKIGGIDPNALLGAVLFRKQQEKEKENGATEAILSEKEPVSNDLTQSGPIEIEISKENINQGQNQNSSLSNEILTSPESSENDQTGRVISFSIIDSLGPSDTRLAASHSIAFERPAGPKKKYAATRRSFAASSVYEVDTGDSSAISHPPPSINEELIDQVAFANPILETSENGESIPVGSALAKQALEQMKNLKKTEPIEKPLSPKLEPVKVQLKKTDHVEKPASPTSTTEFPKVQLRKTEQLDKRPASPSVDKPNEALLALSRLKKVESSPIAKEQTSSSFEVTIKKDIKVSSPSDTPSTVAASVTDSPTSRPSIGLETIISSKKRGK